MKILIIGLIAFSGQTLAQSSGFPNYPGHTVLTSDSQDKQGIKVLCNPISETPHFKIQCTFNQISVSYKQDPNKIDSDYQKTLDEFKSSNLSFLEIANKLCNDISETKETDLNKKELEYLSKAKIICNLKSEKDAESKLKDLFYSIKKTRVKTV